MANHLDDNNFHDLEIRIFARDTEGYPVEITLAAQQEFQRGYLSPEISSWRATGDPITDGQQLFDALFSDNFLRTAWATAQGQAPQRRIRLRIDSDAAELHALPWELLQDNADMLAANAKTPFSRYLPIALPWGAAASQRPIRILVVISNPDDLKTQHNLAPLDLSLERETLEAAFASALSDSPGEIETIYLEPPITMERLEQALREGVHILHYIGHGAYSARRQQAALYLQDEAGHTQIVPDDALARMLASQAHPPHLVFLAACQSATRDSAEAFRGLGPKLVSIGVPAVIAMQDAIAIESARKLSSVFYQRLLDHGNVDQAMNEARSTLLTAGRPDAAVPVLFMRLKSGQLWGAEADARGQVLGSKNPKIFWSGLIRMIKQGKCTPIIGPRVHGHWLPKPESIARRWSETHGYPFVDKTVLARVAQYMASSQGEDFPRYELLDTLVTHLESQCPEALRPTQHYNSVTDYLKNLSWSDLVAGDPNEVHQVLARLHLPLYLTTNYDSFMLEALKAQGVPTTRELCRWREVLDILPSNFEDDPNYEPKPDSPMVYHLFGTDQEPESVVLTEDSYLDFLINISAERERIPHYIRGAIASSTLLFIGYSLYDWEFRVIMRGLVATMDQRRRFKHVAVQLERDEMQNAESTAIQSFLQQYFQDADINVFWGSPAQFSAELREQWEAAQR